MIIDICVYIQRENIVRQSNTYVIEDPKGDENRPEMIFKEKMIKNMLIKDDPHILVLHTSSKINRKVIHSRHVIVNLLRRQKAYFKSNYRKNTGYLSKTKHQVDN